MTHFEMVNIFYSSKYIAKKAGTLYPDTTAYIICIICLVYVLVFMAALWNRAGHYIFALWFLLLSFFLSFFSPHLISTVAGWMSTILAHMVWP